MKTDKTNVPRIVSIKSIIFFVVLWMVGGMATVMLIDVLHG